MNCRRVGSNEVGQPWIQVPYYRAQVLGRHLLLTKHSAIPATFRPHLEIPVQAVICHATIVGAG